MSQRQQPRRQQAQRQQARAQFQAPLADLAPDRGARPAALASPAGTTAQTVTGPVLTARGSPVVQGADRESDACDNRRSPTLTMAEVIRRFGPEYRRQAGDRLTAEQDRVLRELLVCRTEVLGAHYWSCQDCGHEVVLYHSCKNRHCPQCGAYDRRVWAQKVQADLLPIQYDHLVVTLPHPLTLLACDHPRVLYPLVLRACADAVLGLARRELGVELGMLVLPHTWGQVMNKHVHAHSLVSCGGLSLDGTQFLAFPGDQFLSLDQIAREFRDVFLKQLDSLYRRGKLVLEGPWRQLDWPGAWEAFLADWRTIKGVVFSRGVWDRREEGDTSGELERAVKYLAHYANRVAMSNSRLVSIEGQEVVFRYKDHRDGGTWHTTSLSGVTFLERFLWHLVPKGLRRIRRFGWWGPAVRTEKLALLRRLLGVRPPEETGVAPPPTEWDGDTEEAPDEELRRLDEEQGMPRTCRACGGKLKLAYQTRRPRVADLLRMPPNMEPLVETGPVQLHLPISAFL